MSTECKRWILFYADGSYQQMDRFSPDFLKKLPHTTYLFDTGTVWEKDKWYRTDLTPVLLADVPKQFRVLLLLIR